MMMIVNINDTIHDFATISDELEHLGENIGVNIKLQHEDIFNKMHRI